MVSSLWSRTLIGQVFSSSSSSNYLTIVLLFLQRVLKCLYSVSLCPLDPNCYVSLAALLMGLACTTAPDLLKPFVFLSLPSALASPQPIVLALLWWVWIKPFSKSDSTVVQRRMSPVRFHLMNITEVKVKAGHRGDFFFHSFTTWICKCDTHTKTHTQCYVFYALWGLHVVIMHFLTLTTTNVYLILILNSNPVQTKS